MPAVKPTRAKVVASTTPVPRKLATRALTSECPDTARKRRTTSINQLFADKRCSKAILRFLATTRIGREAGPPPGEGETDREREDSPGEGSDSEREGEEAETELGGVNEDRAGALAQVAGDGHGEGDEGQALAQAVIDLILGRRVPLTPHGG